MKLATLRAALVRSTFFEPTDLPDAVSRMGFVQADPIRAPARAQDLILRQRVAGYRQGELEQRYPELDLDEDLVYAYGFVPARTGELLHPRGGETPRGLARDVLGYVQRSGATHPNDLERHFGRRRAPNAWGAQSRATTRVLHHLHYQGHLRVARRDAGVRVYESARPHTGSLTAEERRRSLVLLVADLLGPLPEPSLRSVINQLRYALPKAPRRRTIIPQLLTAGDLERDTIDGVPYVWSAPHAVGGAADVPRLVRFLAPFDPLVWDRRRFEHLWGWSYRFEAYTPAVKRKLGYYALPLLWVDQVVGWVNLSVKSGELGAEFGFVKRRPRGPDFTRALDEEMSRVGEFLGVPART